MRNRISLSQLIYLIRCYQSNTLTEADSALLHQWLKESEENRKLFEDILSTYKNKIIEEMSLLHPDEQYDDFITQIQRRKKKRIRAYFFTGCAAVSFLFVILFLALYSTRMYKESVPFRVGQNEKSIETDDKIVYINEKGDSEIINDTVGPHHIQTIASKALKEQADTARSHLKAETTYSTLLTPKGKRLKLFLEDGTLVHLNERSKITFSNDLHLQPEREITLNGEAYFEVVNNHTSFVVHSRGQEIKVLGTKFNICGYSSDDQLQVGLIEGKVDVNISDLETTTTLIPGEMLTYNQNSSNLNIKNIPIHKMALWREGILFFDQEDIKSVTAMLARRYGVDFIYDSDLPTSLFSGELSAEEELDKVLDKLALTGKVKFKKNEKGKISVSK